jgi:hypothetical protein
MSTANPQKTSSAQTSSRRHNRDSQHEEARWRKEQRDTRDEWISWVISDTGITALTRLVGVQLALSINIEELSFPSVGRRADIGAHYDAVAKHLGITSEMAGFAIAELQERRWLRVIRQTTGHYRIELTPEGRRNSKTEVRS